MQFENGLVITGGSDVRVGFNNDNDFYDKRKDKVLDFVDITLSPKEYKNVIKRALEIEKTGWLDYNQYTLFLQSGEYTPAKKHESHTCASTVAYSLGYSNWWKFDCDELKKQIEKDYPKGKVVKSFNW